MNRNWHAFKDKVEYTFEEIKKRTKKMGGMYCMDGVHPRANFLWQREMPFAYEIVFEPVDTGDKYKVKVWNNIK